MSTVRLSHHELAEELDKGKEATNRGNRDLVSPNGPKGGDTFYCKTICQNAKTDTHLKEGIPTSPPNHSTRHGTVHKTDN